MAQFLKNRIADYALCLCLTLCIVEIVCSGFVLTDSLSANAAAVTGISALLQLVFLLFSRSRRAAGLGFALLALCAAGAIAYARTSLSFADESANSSFLFGVIVCVSALCVFLFSRTRIGCVVLYFTGLFLGAGAHFLQFPAPLWAILLFSVVGLLLMLYRTHTQFTNRAAIIMSRPYAHLRQCFALCLSAVLLAGAVYAGVVKPLCPPTAELKLITTLKSMDVLEVLGVARTQTILSSDLQSSRPPQESENAGEQNENKPESNEPNPPEDLPQDGENRESIITSTIQQAFEGVSYTVEQRGSLWLFLLIPAAIALAYAYRYESRQRWRRKLQQLKPEDAVINLYRFFLARFARLGLGRRKTISLRQYAQQNAVQLSAFDTDEVSFAQLTEIYEKVVYGHAPVSEQELAAFRRYYDGFYPALQREVGGVKYWLTAFKY